MKSEGEENDFPRVPVCVGSEGIEKDLARLLTIRPPSLVRPRPICGHMHTMPRPFVMEI